MAATVPEGEWISGTLYDHFRLAERRHITRAELDAAAPRHPVILERYGHECVVNSVALRLAGIDERTPTPAGGIIGRSPDRRLSGLLVDTTMGRLRPTLPAITEVAMAERLQALADECHQVGITSSHDAGVGFYSPVQASAYQQLRGQDGFRLRVNMVMANFYHPGRDPSVGSFVRASGIRTGFGDQWLKVGPVKLMADGGASGGSAAMFEPFEGDPDNVGCTYWEQAELYTMNGAYAAFEEFEKGSLEVGKLADLAIVSADLTRLPPENLRDVRVDMTVVGGEVVYERRGSDARL